MRIAAAGAGHEEKIPTSSGETYERLNSFISKHDGQNLDNCKEILGYVTSVLTFGVILLSRKKLQIASYSKKLVNFVARITYQNIMA